MDNSRRRLVKSLVSVPAGAAASGLFGQQNADKNASRQNGAPVGPPLVTPGVTELPATPVTGADAACDMQPRTLDPEQYEALTRLSELIAPSRGDIPGAREGDVSPFLDFLIGVSPETTLDLYRKGLDELNAEARRRYGKPFRDLGPQEARPILASLDQPWEFQDPQALLPRFLRVARGDVVRATLNSRSYLDAISQTRRSRQGSGFYWYPMS